MAGPGGGGGGTPGGGPNVAKDSPHYTVRVIDTPVLYCTVQVQGPGSAYNKSIHAVKKRLAVFP